MNFNKQLLEKSSHVDEIFNYTGNGYGIRFHYKLLKCIPWSKIVWYGSVLTVDKTKQYIDDIAYVRQYFQKLHDIKQ